jgi:hypothetical protein
MKAMLYYHHDTTTPQILEGIDKIQLKLNENLYPTVKRNKLNECRNELNIIKSKASKFHSGFYYLNIHGEYIDHSQSLLVTITKALLACLQDGAFSLPVALDNLEPVEYNLRFIRENIFLFIDNESGIEFCFDFMPQSINVTGEIIICPPKGEYNDEYAAYIKKSIFERLEDRKLIQYENTFYSLDDKGSRDSTISLYNRNLRLLGKGNEYSVSDIIANAHSKRIEFRITNKAFREYLHQENMMGDYKTVVEWFTPLLARRYYAYFYGLVHVIDDGHHPMFQAIYNQVLALAASNTPYSTKMPKNFPELEKVKSTPKGKLGTRLSRKYKYPQDVQKAVDKERKRQDSRDTQSPQMEDGLDKLFPYLYTARNFHYHGPIDYMDKSKIDTDLSDDEFVFFKNNWQGPKGYLDPKTLYPDNDDSTSNNE